MASVLLASARAGKRRVIAPTHVNEADRKEPPLKKVCTGKYSAALDTTVVTRGVKLFGNSDSEYIASDDQPIGNSVPVPTTNRLNPAPEGEALVTTSNTVNFSGMDLRSVIMNLRNKKVAKRSEMSTSTRRKNECEDENLRL